MVVHEITGRTLEKSVWSDQDGIDVKSDVNGMVFISLSGREIYPRFWCQGEIRWRVKVA